jgi:hypothetical protein
MRRAASRSPSRSSSGRPATNDRRPERRALGRDRRLRAAPPFDRVHDRGGGRGTAVPRLEPEHWPGRAAMAGEIATLATHAGTHVDAPYHYGPADSGQARTIDRVPLSWLFGPGVVLDVRGASRVDGVRGRTSRPSWGVSVTNSARRRRPRLDGHEPQGAGLTSAILACGVTRRRLLVDRGVRLIGIDAWGLDRPFDVMADEAKAGDTDQLWESHVLGRTKGTARSSGSPTSSCCRGRPASRSTRSRTSSRARARGWTVVAIYEEEREREAGREGRRWSRAPDAGSASRSPRASRARRERRRALPQLGGGRRADRGARAEPG